LWAVILSFTLYPVQKRLLKWFKGRHGWAALVVTSLAVFLVVGPVTLIALSLVDDGKKLALAAKEEVLEAPDEAPQWVTNIPILGGDLSGYWQEFVVSREKWINRKGNGGGTEAQVSGDISKSRVKDGDGLQSLVEQGVTGFRKFVVWTGVVVGKGLAQITVSLFLVFFLLRDAEKLGQRLNVAVHNMAGERGRRLLKVAGQTVKGVVYGYLGTSAAQAVIAGIGFMIAGVPGAVLLAALTFFIAVIPAGPPVIWGGAAVWLFMEGRMGWTVFMVLWGILGISSVDNLLRPYLVSQGNKMPFALMFLGLIGGAIAFGLVGVFLGPTMLAVAFRLTDEWTSGSGAITRR
jgi:predicted PurR-regulated permease PerM